MLEDLSNPLWRLHNLYSIKQEGTGRSLLYAPRPEQEEVIKHLIETPHDPLYIIKSRRLGMSTGLGVFAADQAISSEGFSASLIDQTQADAHRKMINIIRYAVKSLPEKILSSLEFPKCNDGEITIKTLGSDDTSSSNIYAGMNARGGDSSMLWVSEWGPIAATDPVRSREIRTGALPSARLGRRVVETTWYGGKGGDLWELIEPILKQDPNAEGRILFFPWHGDPECIRTAGMVTKEIEDYFKELAAKLGSTFSQEQKKWYASKKVEQGIFIKREYPSTLDEAMSAPVEGSIYGACMTALQVAGGVRSWDVDKSALVHTFWDLGSPENTVCWYVQFVQDEIRFLDVDISFEGTLIDRIAHMMSKGYAFGCHFLPHDAAATKTSGKTIVSEMNDAGLQNIRIIPRTNDIWIGINRVIQIFPRFRFRVPATEKGISALENYHTKKMTLGVITADLPVHDWSSHPSDGVRMVAEAIMAGLVPGSGLGSTPRKAFHHGTPRSIMGFRG